MCVYIGIDWSQDKHDVAIMCEDGRRLLHFVMPHKQDGFAKLPQQCQQHGLQPSECHIAIETSFNLLVDYLWSYGFDHVYVIPPSVVKSSRSRYTNSGARNDQSDAYLLADLLRTDGHRFAPWQPDTLLTCQMRSLVNLLAQLTRRTTGLSNQLRSLLLRYYPALLELFPDLTAKTALAFLDAYPTPQAAATLTAQALRQFLRQHRYPQPDRLVAKLPQLLSPTLQTIPATAQVYAYPAVMLATQLSVTLDQKATVQAKLTTLFRQHPDHDIFASLPGAGEFLAPALLVQFGDHRDRFPAAADVQALAGTVPATAQSGKARHIHFRQACDRQFRYVATQLAGCAVTNSRSPYAVAYFQDQIARGKSANLAYRCLANRLLAVAWKLWRTHTTYDAAFHTQQRLQHHQPQRQPQRQPQPAAAAKPARQPQRKSQRQPQRQPQFA